ncbi:hypothetical protein [Pusillimonas noertemannii]|uniref:Uncharacterized protein n=1 Tax=Pusillimonas noertemannii TaxID=305977 RepID=A0A2U1CRS4_9BURK|nr:hypothetical protein [Pusillimonas noertemannii]NYT67928.1 hypothetical protein [Pusillimonas noertemannii]PVY68598.1 hypothetical protein C7440_1009 [Pusillimonas noertemannii]TFL11929.1 hypothetical protein CSC72_02010 [Pusillimonas noertemannii]
MEPKNTAIEADRKHDSRPRPNGQYFEGVNIERLRKALTAQGIAAPESLEELAATLARHINALTMQVADRQRRELPDTSFTNWLDRHGYDTTIGLDGDYADTDVAMLHEAYRLGSQRRGEPVGYVRKDQLNKVQRGWSYMCQIQPKPQEGTVAIYTTPQPAEPVKVPSFAVVPHALTEEMINAGAGSGGLGMDYHEWLGRIACAWPKMLAAAPPATNHRVNPTVEPMLDTPPVTPEEEEAWRQMERRNE